MCGPYVKSQSLQATTGRGLGPEVIRRGANYKVTALALRRLQQVDDEDLQSSVQEHVRDDVKCAVGMSPFRLAARVNGTSGLVGMRVPALTVLGRRMVYHVYVDGAAINPVDVDLEDSRLHLRQPDQFLLSFLPLL